MKKARELVRTIESHPEYCVDALGTVFSQRYGGWRKVFTSTNTEGNQVVSLYGDDGYTTFCVHELVKCYWRKENG